MGPVRIAADPTQGRRSASGQDARKQRMNATTEEPMLKMLFSLSTTAALAASALSGAAQAQGAAAPNLAGSYRCQPQPMKCQWGDTVSITQTGDKVQLNNDSGSFADGKITSNITVSGAPPFNANGVILPDRSIQWSNGTHWMKQ
jgi:hypothetical protein